jgi:SAM-dependent methyltransferase
MEGVEGARSFEVSRASYDAFMGRYSNPLAHLCADAAGVSPGQAVLDVGCGPGALTAVLLERVGKGSVAACDPSDAFVAECTARCPDALVRPGRAEAVPFEPDSFDRVLAQLVMHFVSDPDRAVGEFLRVLRPGGVAAACVWEFGDGMEMLNRFWAAALALDPDAPDEGRHLRFGRPGELAELFDAGGLDAVEETALRVTSTYADFEELWAGFLLGIGPSGAYCLSLPEPARQRLHDQLFASVGSPTGAFTLGAVARCATGRAPS